MFHNNKETFISENCNICGEELTQVEDILVDVESGNYICKDCSDYHNIKTSECKEY